MMDTWPIGFFGNGIVALSFLAISITLARALTKTKQWNGNPLAVGICMLYLTCGIGHGIGVAGGPAARPPARRGPGGPWRV
jgi:hypothetical protein